MSIQKCNKFIYKQHYFNSQINKINHINANSPLPHPTFSKIYEMQIAILNCTAPIFLTANSSPPNQQNCKLGILNLYCRRSPLFLDPHYFFKHFSREPVIFPHNYPFNKSHSILRALSLQ